MPHPPSAQALNRRPANRQPGNAGGESADHICQVMRAQIDPGRANTITQTAESRKNPARFPKPFTDAAAIIAREPLSSVVPMVWPLGKA